METFDQAVRRNIPFSTFESKARPQNIGIFKAKRIMLRYSSNQLVAVAKDVFKTLLDIYDGAFLCFAMNVCQGSKYASGYQNKMKNYKKLSRQTLHTKMKFSIKDFFSKCDQIPIFLRIFCVQWKCFDVNWVMI